MKHRFSFAALTAVGSALALPAAAQLPAAYTISDLGVVAVPVAGTTVADVTRTGYALENYFTFSNISPEYNHTTMYVTKNGTVVFTASLGIGPTTPNGSSGGVAKKINDSGTTIGNYGGYEYPNTAFAYPLGQPNNGQPLTIYSDINSNGKIAGYFDDYKYTSQWTAIGGVGLSGDVNSEANGVSENGLVAGASGQGFNPYAFQAPPLVKHAFVWTPTTPNGSTGTSRALTIINAGDNSEAFAVNDLGEAVGTSGSSNVYWNANGKPTLLPSSARSINNKSEILFSGNRIGTPTGTIQYPLSAISNPAGWSSLYIYKLYDDGALVGTGQLNGATHIFLLTPVPVSLSGNITLEGATHNGQTVTFTFRPTNGAAPTVLTTTLGANGAYALNVPPDNYSLLIHADKYLQVAAPLNIAGSQTASLSAFLPAGDANADNRVDVLDFGILVDAYGSLASDPASGYDANADFNDDGSVDVVDFGLLVNSYGEDGAI